VIDQHLPVLQIVIPLLTAPLCVLIRARRRVLALVIAVSWLAFAMSARLLWLVGRQGVISYALGGWPAPWGIEYRVDPLSGLMLTLVAGMGAMVITYAPQSVDREIVPERQTLFYTMYLLCLTGLLGIVITGDLFNLFVFLEISSLSTYALVSLGRSRRALVSAFQYLIMGTLGGTFLLIGIGLSYQMTGTLNMLDLARLLPESAAPGTHRTMLVAFGFLSVGISIKMALFPLHQWLPNAYAYAPSVVTAFLAATSTKVSVYVLLRIIFTIYQPQFAFGRLPLDWELTFVSLIGVFVASLAAICQQDLKRMLAYSSIAQLGYIVLGVALGSASGLAAGILHLLNHALIKGSLFMATGCYALRVSSLRLDDLQGIGRRMPWTTFAWVLAGLGLIGVPTTAGFVSKWYLLSALLAAGRDSPGFGYYHVIAVLVLVGSLLAVIYVWRFVETAYFREPTGALAEVEEAPIWMLLPTYVVVSGSLLFGIWTSFPIQLAAQAAQALLGADP